MTLKPDDVNSVTEEDYQKTEGPEETDAIEDMLSGFWPEEKREPETPPVDDGGDKKPEDDQPPAVEEPPQEAQPPATKIYKYRGKDYTAEQLVEQGILEDALTSAEQLPHYQQLYLEKLEAERQAQAQPQPQAQPEPQRITPDQILRAYEPVARQTAEMGFIEPDFVEAWPNMAAALMFHRDMVYDMRRALEGVLSYVNQQASGNFRQSFLSGLESTLNELSTEGEHYALLKDRQTRSGFYEYLRTLDVPVSSVNKQFLAKQWLAYNSDAMLEAITAAEQDRRAVEKRKAAQSAGEAASSAKTKPVTPPVGTQQEHIDDMLEGFWPSS